jgi:hypothetical protein
VREDRLVGVVDQRGQRHPGHVDHHRLQGWFRVCGGWFTVHEYLPLRS